MLLNPILVCDLSSVSVLIYLLYVIFNKNSIVCVRVSDTRLYANYAPSIYIYIVYKPYH